MEASQSNLSELSKLVKQAVELEKEIEAIENLLTYKTSLLQKLIQTDIPSAMETLGFEEISTEDGWEIKIKRDYKFSISQANHEQAMQWLVDNGFEDLIKHDVISSFARGEHDRAVALRDSLVADGHNVKDKEGVNHMTFGAWLREQKELGTDIPDELFGVYPITKAKLTKGQ